MARRRRCRATPTIRRLPTSTSSTGSLPVFESAAASAISDIRGDLHGGLFQAALQRRERVVETFELLVVELGENELVQGFLPLGEAGQMLVGLVGQRHLDDSGILGRGLAA